MTNGKLLFLDIETSPARVYAWGTYKQTIGHNQVIDPGGLLCFGAKWAGEEECLFYSDWFHGKDRMIKEAHNLLSKAGAVVTYNGDKFDLPKLHGEFLLRGLPPPPPLTSIDVYKTVKKMGYLVNKLAFIGPLLGVGQKVDNEGFSLWTKVLEGDRKAQEDMERYCKGDVILLEDLYDKVKPYIKTHPFIGESSQECGVCGHSQLVRQGYKRTKHFLTQRLQCKNCGSWQLGTRKKIGAVCD